jgi:branched-chain amino acid transport system substrate-binding protein
VSRLLFLAVVFALMLGPFGSPSRAAVEPLEIHAILSVTGTASFLGREEADALQLVAARTNKTGGVNGRPIAFVVHDDQSNAQVALQLFNGLLVKKPAIVLASTLVASCAAIAPLLENGPVVYCLSTGFYAPKGSYMFEYGISTTSQIRVLFRYFRDRGLKRFAAIFPTDAGGQDAERIFTESLALPENAGVTLVSREHFNNTDLSVSAQMARIKGANPQVLIVWATGTPLGTVLHAAADLGIDLPTAASAGNLNYNEMTQFAQILPKELDIMTAPGVAPDAVPAGPLKVAAMAFNTAAKAAGFKPDGNLLIGWDPATIAVGALKKLGADATSAQIREYLEGLHGWYGAAGEYDFRDGSQRGLSGDTAVIVRYDGARQLFVPVSKLGGSAK